MSGQPAYRPIGPNRAGRNRPKLLITQRYHEGDSHGAARGNVGGEDADDEHQRDGEGQRQGVGRLQAEEQAGNPLLDDVT